MTVRVCVNVCACLCLSHQTLKRPLFPQMNPVKPFSYFFLDPTAVGGREVVHLHFKKNDVVMSSSRRSVGALGKKGADERNYKNIDPLPHTI